MHKVNSICFLDEDTLVVMDTNVWLDLYKLPPTAIISIIEAISIHKNKFWLPYQVYIEYNRHVKKNREEALGRYCSMKSESCTLLNETKDKVNQKFENLKRNNIFEATQAQKTFKNKMMEIIAKIKTDLGDLDVDYQKEITCISGNDIIQGLIEKLHTDSGTKGFSINELVRIYEEGEIRYKYKVAPGYSDIKKENHEGDNDFLLRKYGDLIIWKEILQRIQWTKTKLIFVQNEKKSDWWQTPQSHTIAKVIAEEYQEATSNNGSIEMVDFEQLLNMCGENLGLPATTVKDIVAKLKFEKAVCKYVDASKDAVLEEYVHKAYEEDDRAYELLQDISLFGGYVESVDDFEIDNINIIISNFDYDNDWELSYVGAEVEIDCTASITEYVNKYVCHSGSISFKIHFEITINFSVDFSNLEASEEDAYEITGYDIQDEEIKDIIQNEEFSIDVDVDEDVFRDR